MSLLNYFGTSWRRLLSSALDSTVRVWDLPTGRCLSWLLFDSPVQSMTGNSYTCV
jgi:WD40 repeat protein